MLLMKTSTLTRNHDQEPSNDHFVEDVRMLMVCLDFETHKKDSQITKAVFAKDCGRVLRRKGFQDTFGCSYGEGIVELDKNENRCCPDPQLWLFSSPGDGNVSAEAHDRDMNKIQASLRAVNDFWSDGSALLLFCDKGP
jgi:hypothetical protein